MEKKGGLALKTAWAIAISAVGKALGFAKSAILAAVFGATALTDAFYLATGIIGVVNGFSAAISTVVVPTRAEKLANEGRDSADGLTTALLAVMTALSAALAVLAFAGAPLLVKAFAPGYEGETLAIAVRMFRILTPIMLLTGLFCVYSGVLICHQKLAAWQFANVLINVVWTAAAALLASRLGVYAMVAAYMLGMAAQLLVLIPASRGVFRLTRWTAPFSEIIRIIKLCVPAFISNFAGLISQMVDRALATGLIAGSVSALNYGAQLTSVVTGVITTNITTALFASMSALAGKGDHEALKAILIKVCSVSSMVLAPITAISLIMNKEIVRAVFQRGAFDEQAVAFTSTAFLFYSLDFIPYALGAAFTRCFHALQDMKTPTKVYLSSVAVDVVLNLILVRFMGLAGLALATAVSSFVSCFALMFLLRRRMGALGYLAFLRNLVKIAVAVAVLTLAAFLLKPLLISLHPILQFGIVTAASGLAYVLTLFALRQDDLLGIVRGVLRRG